MKLLKWKSKKQKEELLEESLEGKKTIEDYLKEKESEKENTSIYVPQKAFQVKTEEEVNQFLEVTISEVKEAKKAIKEAKEEYESITNSLKDIQVITDMPEDEKQTLEEAADKIKNLTEERKTFQKGISKITQAQYSQIDSYGEEIRTVMKKMDEDEKYSQLIQNDMQLLEGEKATLHYDIEDYQTKLEILQKLTGGVLFLLALCLVFFFVCVLAIQEDYSMMLYIALGGIGMSLAIIFVKHQEYRRGLKITEGKLNRAISLLNQAKIRYVNVQNSLDFQYSRYQVHSAYELNHLWGLYLEAKKEREQYRHNSQELHEAETELLGILSEYELNDPRIWIYRADAILDNREMVEVRHDLNVRRQRIRENIEYNRRVVEKTNETIKDFARLNKDYGEMILTTAQKGLKDV